MRIPVPFGIAAVLLLAAAAWQPAALAQTEPEVPEENAPLRNGFQISLFGGVSLNSYTGAYFGDCPCDYWENERSWSVPYGVALHVPLFEDAALYLRGSLHRTSTDFFVGRYDSLRSAQTVGSIGDDMTIHYSLATIDVLLRLIGHLDGERVYIGPSFGIVQQKRVHIVETEYATGTRWLLTNRDIEGARDLRVSIVIGAEYAFMPLRNLSIIPAIEIDYAPKKISDWQPLRVTFYRALIGVSYQVF
jgi:hypothetical protein